jgi:hypothetical protein
MRVFHVICLVAIGMIMNGFFLMFRTTSRLLREGNAPAVSTSIKPAIQSSGRKLG